MDYSPITIVFFKVVSILFLSVTIFSLVFVPKRFKKLWIKMKWTARYLWVLGCLLGVVSIITLIV